MRYTGLLIVTIALLLPLIWFVPLVNKHDALAIFSQYIGVYALIAMAFAQIFATRFGWLETVFGGLDRIYVLHKWLGITAMATVLLHDTIDAEVDGVGAETWLTDIAETAGEISLYGLLILVVITLAVFIPYHLWIKTHKFMGAFFAASAFHYFFILKPFADTDPLGLYVGGFCIIGIAAYFYTLVPMHMFRPKFDYHIDQIAHEGGSISVTLAPRSKKLKHEAGQFAFLKFDLPNLDEVHPFTISDAPRENGKLRFTIKALGDYTHTLPSKIDVGTPAIINGPYGHFGRHATHKNKHQIWVAAGIGITPFLALANDVKNDSKTSLFYCVKSQADAAHLKELTDLAERNDDFDLHLVQSSIDKRLTADHIMANVKTPIDDVVVAFCGPEKMRVDLKKQFAKRGLNPKYFAYEEFEIRSGIGILAALAWAKKRFF